MSVLNLTIQTVDGRSTEIQVSASSTFEDMKNILAVEFKTNPAYLLISYKGDTSIPDSETVGNQGLADKDMLLAIIQNPSQPAANPSQTARPANRGPNLGIDTQIFPPALRNLFGGPGANNTNHGGSSGAAPGNAQQAAVNERRRANAAAINENYQKAMEESPESFASVYMLYIDVKINGVPVKAFVDSGAQSTVMSKECAERTGIIGLVDPRFAGVAVGVGSAKIIGKVHLAPVEISETFYNCSFSVLDKIKNMDLLLGLDLLKKYQCNIDLKRDQLVIGTTGQKVKFLPESELPKHARLH